MRVFSVALLVFSVGVALGAGELSGRRAPGFSLPDSKFRQHDLHDYRGKILLVEIMQTKCPHCAQFSTILEQVQAKYAGKVAVLSIVNPPDNQGTVAEYVARHKLTMPILFDCGQMSASYLRVTPQKPSFDVPHVFIIDADGNILNDYGYNLLNRQIFEGRALFDELDRLLGGSAK